MASTATAYTESMPEISMEMTVLITVSLSSWLTSQFNLQTNSHVICACEVALCDQRQ